MRGGVSSERGGVSSATTSRPWNGKPAVTNSFPRKKGACFGFRNRSETDIYEASVAARVSDCHTHVLVFGFEAFRDQAPALLALPRPSKPLLVACSVTADISFDSVLFPWMCTCAANQLSLARSPGFARCRTFSLSGAQYTVFVPHPCAAVLCWVTRR